MFVKLECASDRPGGPGPAGALPCWFRGAAGSHQQRTRCGGEPDTCKDSDGPTADTVRQAIASVPIIVPGSTWVEIARGHTRKCRLYWVQIIPTIASESTPQQLLFFDHNTPLGTPTPNPKPYITVLPPSDDTITVRTNGRRATDEPCCPTGMDGEVPDRI